MNRLAVQTASPLLPGWRRQSEHEEELGFSPSYDFELDWTDATDFETPSVRHRRRQLLDTVRCRATTPFERLDCHLESFKLSSAAFAAVAHGVRDDIGRGLQANVQYPGVWLPHISSFRMIDSFLADLPDGSERGVAYSVHIDTQRVRITRLELCANDRRASALADRSWPLFDSGLISRRVSATRFFDAIVTMLSEVKTDLTLSF